MYTTETDPVTFNQCDLRRTWDKRNWLVSYTVTYTAQLHKYWSSEAMFVWLKHIHYTILKWCYILNSVCQFITATIVLPLVQWWLYHQQWAGHQVWPLSPHKGRWCWNLRRKSLAGMEWPSSTHRQKMGWRLMRCGREREGRQAKTKDGLMNVCKHVVCATKIRENKRDVEILLSYRAGLTAALKCVGHDMIYWFPRVEAFHT